VSRSSAIVRPGRLLEIDSLRGVAALWVVVFHFTFGVSYAWLKADPELAARVAPFGFNTQGLLAVDLFFMISGFVIFMTLERSKSVMDFTVSRFSRLYPAYWVCLLLTTMTIILAPLTVQTITVPQIIAGATMVNAYIGFNPVESVYWSLGVEVAFYVIMAGVFKAGLMHRIEWLGGLWLAISALTFTVFPELGAMLPWRVQTASILPYTPLFFAGILLYRTRTHGWTAVRAALLAACLLVRLATFQRPTELIGTALIFVTFLTAALGWPALLRWPLLLFLGRISYPLYLIHESIGFRVQYWAVMTVGLNAMGGFLVALGAMLILAWAVSVLVERPAQRWIRGAYRNVSNSK
jgi:peptidoglycan/LPS O-acetylase OafA/YrhL